MLLVAERTITAEGQGIGKIFRGHNIFEYKSPDDALNIDTFYKGIAYASLYKANGTGVNKIRANDITLSFVRKRTPKGLFKALQSEGMFVEQAADGIYRVSSPFPFAIQIIVSKELDRDEYIWLTSLADDLTLQNAEKIIVEASAFEEKDDKEYVDSVLQVVMSRNRTVFQQVKEESENMCEALRELMKPEWDAMVAEKEAEMAEMKEEKAIMEAEIRALREQLAKANQ